MDELTIHRLLANSCSNPEDGEEWMRVHQENNRRRNATPREEELEYTGWNKYEIDLCCIKFIIIARMLPYDGEWDESKVRYEIKEWRTE